MMATMGFSRDGKNTFAFSGEQMCRSWYVYWRRGYMITDAAEARLLSLCSLYQLIDGYARGEIRESSI